MKPIVETFYKNIAEINTINDKICSYFLARSVVFIIFLAATKWPAQGTVMSCSVCPVSSNSKYLYLPISLSIQLGSL